MSISVRDVPLKEFSDGLHRPLDEDLAALRLANETDGVPLILAETEEILGLLLDLTKPSRILEIGTAHGYSALYFAKKCPDSSVTTIERNPVMIEAAEAEFSSRDEGKRIEFITGDAQEILDGLAAECRSGKREKFDFVFIDAAKSHYREFLEAAEEMCTHDAIIACDNILMKGWLIECDGEVAKRHRTSIKYMKLFLEYLKSREDLDVCIMTGGDGLAVIRFRND